MYEWKITHPSPPPLFLLLLYSSSFNSCCYRFSLSSTTQRLKPFLFLFFVRIHYLSFFLHFFPSFFSVFLSRWLLFIVHTAKNNNNKKILARNQRKPVCIFPLGSLIVLGFYDCHSHTHTLSNKSHKISITCAEKERKK